MADKADIAGDYIEKSLEHALEKQRNQVAPANEEPYCLECGEEIPAKRREALPGCATCVDCQQVLEHHNKSFGK